MRVKPSLALASVLVSAFALTALPAEAACKKFAFLVNDYGKEGPTKDAQTLLDKNIAEWAAQNGVKEYQTGKKTVSCELFLDFVVFDEHTCTAQANVCWGPGVKPNNKGGEQAAAGEESTGDQQHPPAPVRKAAALGVAAQPQQAAAAPAAEAPAAESAATESAAPTSPVEQIVAPAETPAAMPAVHTEATTAPSTPTTTGGVETGALQGSQALMPTTPAPKVKHEKDRAAAAAAAASAAAAAERAAMAAETAANAAKEAAAAAVAASAASKVGAMVPPLDHASSNAKPAHTE